MDLDRGTLAKIDRKVLSGLGHDERYQIVRVPISEAAWSTWRRYCGAVGISMGRAIASLMEHELGSVVEELDGEPLFLAQLKSRAAKRGAALDARERQLYAREQQLGARQHQSTVVPVGSASHVVKVGRNDPCPCGSDLKYKRCHGVR